MKRTLVHVDMDAFYAAVEVRDNPALCGKPLIIGALPHERGVVSTCSYEARKFGVRSAMSIKDAYRRCPHGIYMHPNPRKYKEASDKVHAIWSDFSDIVEYISLDEGFLDVTGSAHLFGGAMKIAFDIKERTKRDTGLTCSVGVGYSMMSAKLASEEKKPDGFFEIPDAESLRSLIRDRDVRIIYGLGPKTAEMLYNAGIYKVCDILQHKERVIRILGNQGAHIIDLAEGRDTRRVVSSSESEAKSISREYTFQHDTDDFGYLKDVLLLIAKDLSLKLRMEGLYGRTITVKVRYGNMKLVTRSKSGEAVNEAREIYKTAAGLLDTIEKRPVRLAGIGLSNFSDSDCRQLSMEDLSNMGAERRKSELGKALLDLQRKYGGHVIKTAHELSAEKRVKETD